MKIKSISYYFRTIFAFLNMIIKFLPNLKKKTTFLFLKFCLNFENIGKKSINKLKKNSEMEVGRIIWLNFQN